MTLDPRSDLTFIREVMEQTRRYTLISGSYMILWGLLISTGLACNLLVSVTTAQLPINGIWIALVAAGWLGSYWLSRREVRYEPVASYAGRIIGQLWFACGAAMTTAFLVGQITGALPGTAVDGLMGLFVGIGVFMAGILTGMNWFRNLAIGWWLGAVGMFVWHGMAAMLISVALLLGLFVVPGVILNVQAGQLRKKIA